jgi:hypothetical protein
MQEFADMIKVNNKEKRIFLPCDKKKNAINNQKN